MEAGRAAASLSKANRVPGAIVQVRKTLQDEAVLPLSQGSSSVTHKPKVEEAKDQMLLGAFRDAVRSALRG